jgi:hypothetical protein
VVIPAEIKHNTLIPTIPVLAFYDYYLYSYLIVMCFNYLIARVMGTKSESVYSGAEAEPGEAAIPIFQEPIE